METLYTAVNHYESRKVFFMLYSFKITNYKINIQKNYGFFSQFHTKIALEEILNLYS